MDVTVLHETDHDLALRGMAYSFKDRAEPVNEWWEAKRERALKRAPLLAPMDGGHNKFIRQIVLFIDIEAPRSFWSEFDTYKVGTVAQSESTMHTLAKRPPTYDDFEEGTTKASIDCFISQWPELKKDITALKENLPEGYLQRRLVTMNYDNVRNIISQRDTHRYKRWDKFISLLIPQLKYPEYLERQK
jgi:hypothetical protein